MHLTFLLGDFVTLDKLFSKIGIMNGVIDGGSPLRLKADVLIRGSAITLAITTITLLDFLKIIIGGQFYSVFFAVSRNLGFVSFCL